MRPVLATALTLVMLCRTVASLAAPPTLTKDPTDPATRYQKHTVGDEPDEWAKHLDDPNPELRLEAVKLLGESNDPAAVRHLMAAVDNADPRISAMAVDSLGRRAAPEAAEMLSEKLFLPGAKPMFQRRLLVALGKIADPSTGQRVMDFLTASTDPELRATAIHALGEIGDASTRGRLQEMSGKENDAALKGLMQEAMTRIAEREIQPGQRGKDGVMVFTHSEPPGGSSVTTVPSPDRP